MIEYHRRVIGFLEKVEGVEGVKIEWRRQGGGHPTLVFSYCGCPVRQTIAASPSRRGAARNDIANLKRRLREIAVSVEGNQEA